MPSDTQLAVMVMIDSGSDPEAAKQAVLADPSITGTLRAQIEDKKREFESLRGQAEAEAFARTPDGRREAARSAAKAAEEHAQTVAEAKMLLQAEGTFGADSLAELTDVEVLHHSGIAVRPELRTIEERDQEALRLVSSGEWARMDDLARGQAARELSDGNAASFSKSMDEFAAGWAGDESDSEAAEGGEGDE